MAQTARSGGRAAAPTERVRLRRKRERGSYEREAVEAILAEALVSHLGIVEDGQPLVIPTLHARDGDVVYCHGSSASRTLRALAQGVPACLTVSLIDGLVLARAAMHHSANYRSAVILGRARAVVDPAEKERALRAVVEHILPGRWAQVRPPDEKELRATAVVALPLREASAKVRTGPPSDDARDMDRPVWAGVIPLRLLAGEPLPDPATGAAASLPEQLRAYRRGTP